MIANNFAIGACLFMQQPPSRFRLGGWRLFFEDLDQCLLLLQREFSKTLQHLFFVFAQYFHLFIFQKKLRKRQTKCIADAL